MNRELAGLPTLLDCVHCGLCVPHCPTHHVTGREAESPRGRIAALRAVGEGRAPLSPALAKGLDDCLVCRACESACPSGISMEALMSGYRHARGDARNDIGARLERAALRYVIPDPELLDRLVGGLRLVAPLLRALPLEIPDASRLRPPAPLEPPPPSGEVRGVVSLFRGCLADRLFRDEWTAAARVLARNGWRVTVPDATCCGALDHHAGEVDAADTHLRRSARALLRDDPDHVVIDAAACLAHVVGSHDEDPHVAHLREKAIDTPGLLVGHGWTPPPTVDGEWIAAPPCHHRHGPVSEDPLREVLDATLSGGYRELPPPEHCCGAAGFYVLRRPALSRRIGAESRARFEESGATGIITGNPGCLLRWESLLGAEKVRHPIVLIDQAYGDG